MKKSDIKRVGICRKYANNPEIKKAVHMLRKNSGYQIKCVYLEENMDSLMQDRIIDAVGEAFGQQFIDMAIVPMKELVRISEVNNELPQGIRIGGIFKRTDTRYVMVRKRNTKDIVHDAVIVTDSDKNVYRISHVYDGVKCLVEKDSGVWNDMLDNNECDAVFAEYGRIKNDKRFGNLKYKYTIIGPDECVPEHGDGIIAVLTDDDKEQLRITRNISHEATAVCFEIEEDILKRLTLIEYIKQTDVYAQIKGSQLEIYADVLGTRGHFRYCEKDTIDKRNLAIRKMVDRINKSM